MIHIDNSNSAPRLGRLSCPLMETAIAVQVLQAIAQETRLDVVRLLVQAGPEGLAAGEISRQLGVVAQTLSFHLKALEKAGVLSVRRDGRSLVYTVRYERVGELMSFLTEKCCAGIDVAATSRKTQAG